MELVAVWVAENDLGEWRTATGIVDNVLDDAANVAVTLCVVVGPELRWGLVETFSDMLAFDQFLQIAHGGCVRVWAVKIEPRPFLWLRMTRPMMCCGRVGRGVSSSNKLESEISKMEVTVGGC